ncbi:MAG TPA: phosphopantetheine-binding protein [Bacteroidia bacterium]|jgi:acyl carrier protein|nr:phosphopantetheine-binding protein [Bacteroidia bacterium]
MRFTEAEIEKIVSEKIFALTHKKISSQADELIESGILNSITLAELAVELEKTLSIVFSFTDINKENFSTPEKIKAFLKNKLD